MPRLIRTIPACLALAAVLVLPGAARGSIPFPANCSVAVNPEASQATVYVLPTGLGDRFDEARGVGGAIVDATITLTLRDAANNPVAGYPVQDIELVIDGLVPCQGQRFWPDGGDTDSEGVTFWSVPLVAGGCSLYDAYISLSGELLPFPIELRFNSADLNGDCVVDHIDCGLFSDLLYSPPYSFCGDFNNDGVINAVDASIFASAYTPQIQYEACRYRLGVFFTHDYASWQPGVLDLATNLDYPSTEPFAMHLVALSCDQPIGGYRARIGMHESFTPVGLTFPAGSGGTNGGAGPFDLDVQFATPQPPQHETEAVLLGTVTVLPTVANLASCIRLLPLSGRNDLEIVIDPCLTLRPNFTPRSHAGCYEDPYFPAPLPPGDFPDCVATTWGSGIATSIVPGTGGVPAAPAISSVAPNPFNPGTAISFVLPRAGGVRLAVHDGRGRLLRTLRRGYLPAGKHELSWDGNDAAGEPVPSGVYLVRLEAPGGVRCTAKATVVR